MNIEHALLCDYAAITMDHKLIAAGIFTALRPPEMPWHHPTMFIVLQIHFAPGEGQTHHVKIRLVDPNGGAIVELGADSRSGEVDPIRGVTVQLVLALNNIPFGTPGRHAFDIFLDGRYEHTVPLEITAQVDATNPVGLGPIASDG